MLNYLSNYIASKVYGLAMLRLPVCDSPDNFYIKVLFQTCIYAHINTETIHVVILMCVI